MNAKLPELTTGTELELTYDGSKGPRTVTAHVVDHDVSEGLLDHEDERHELTLAEPGARRPRFLRISFNTPTDGEFDLEGSYTLVHSQNSKSDRGRRLGVVLGVEVVGDSPERFEACADLRAAEVGEVLVVNSRRGVVTADGYGTTVEFEDGHTETLHTSPELGAIEYVDHEAVARHVEATGEAVEAPAEARELFETCESYGHDDERGKVVAVEHAGETHEVAYRHDADDEGIRFESPSRVGHDSLELDPLGLVLNAERVDADDLDLVFENDDENDDDGDEWVVVDETGTVVESGFASAHAAETAAYEADDETGDAHEVVRADEVDEQELVADGGHETDDDLRHDGEFVLDAVAEGDTLTVVYDAHYSDGTKNAEFTVETRYGRREALGDETDGDRRLRVDTSDGEATVESLHADSTFRAFGEVVALTYESAADEPQFETGDAVADDSEPADERGTMRVLDADAGLAGEVEVGTTGTTVADYDGNEQVADDERVVECVYESRLDSNVPEWDLHDGDLAEFVDDYAAEWGVSVRTYTYPESRLTSVDESDDEGGENDADDDTGEGTEQGDGDESAATGGESGRMVDTRGSPTMPEPDLPTEAELDDEQGDDESDEAAETDGGTTRPDAGGILPLPSVEAVARHVAPFPAFGDSWRHEAAVHELVAEQVERVVEREGAVA